MVITGACTRGVHVFLGQVQPLQVQPPPTTQHPLVKNDLVIGCESLGVKSRVDEVCVCLFVLCVCLFNVILSLCFYNICYLLHILFLLCDCKIVMLMKLLLLFTNN